MNQFGWKNCPQDVKNQVEDLVRTLQRYLADNLVGIYLHGSLALGCFNPKISDLDLLVVIRHGLSVETKRQIVEWLLQRSGKPAPIEISLLRLSDFRPWQYPTPFELHYSEAWRERYQAELQREWSLEAAHDEDLAAHMTVLRQRGICLVGPAVEELFPPVPREDYLASILSDLAWSRDRMGQNPVYHILNHCRVYAFIQTGRVDSKEEGGVWALGVLPEAFRGLVTQALAVYRGETDDKNFDEDLLIRFTDHMEQQIKAAILN